MVGGESIRKTSGDLEEISYCGFFINGIGEGQTMTDVLDQIPVQPLEDNPPDEIWRCRSCGCIFTQMQSAKATRIQCPDCGATEAFGWPVDKYLWATPIRKHAKEMETSLNYIISQTEAGNEELAYIEMQRISTILETIAKT